VNAADPPPPAPPPPDPPPSPPVAVHAVQDGPVGAPVLVLSASLGSTLAMWEPQLPALSARFRVVRYDPRGHGGSPVPAGPYSIADLGVDLLALLDRLHVRRAHVAGLSMGGMTAMWLAAHHPARVASLSLLCTSAKLGPPQAWADRAVTVREQGSGSVAAAVVGRWFTPGWTEANPGETERYRAMVGATPAEGYASCCTAIETMDLLPDLPRITASTLVIAGELDPSTPPEHARMIAAGIAGSRLAVLAAAAHLANVEQPQAVNDLLLGHIQGEGQQ